MTDLLVWLISRGGQIIILGGSALVLIAAARAFIREGGL